MVNGSFLWMVEDTSGSLETRFISDGLVGRHVGGTPGDVGELKDQISVINDGDFLYFPEHQLQILN